MKYVCPGCDRLVEVGAFRLDAGALLLRCPRCSEESRAEPFEARAPAFMDPPAAPPTPPPRPVAAPQALNVVPLRPGTSEAVRLALEASKSDDPFKVPDGRCPKCVAARPDGAEACPACGLTYELFDPATVKPSTGLSQRWVALLAAWEDAALHERMLQESVARGELATVGRLYRLRLVCSPEDPIAAHGRDEVLRLATAHGAAAVPTARGSAEADPEPWKKQAPAFAFAVFVLMVLLFLGRHLFHAGPP
jgi:hypothetical protein